MGRRDRRGVARVQGYCPAYGLVTIWRLLSKTPIAGKNGSITNSIGMKLVYIAPGKFQMGSPKKEQDSIRKQFGENAGKWADQERQHEVVLTQGFYTGLYTVTQEEYEKVIDKNPRILN